MVKNHNISYKTPLASISLYQYGTHLKILRKKRLRKKEKKKKILHRTVFSKKNKYSMQKHYFC